MDGQGIKCRRNIAENINRLSRAHERYRRQTDRQTDRQTTDGRGIAYSERERESPRSLKIGTDSYATEYILVVCYTNMTVIVRY